MLCFMMVYVQFLMDSCDQFAYARHSCSYYLLSDLEMYR